MNFHYFQSKLFSNLQAIDLSISNYPDVVGRAIETAMNGKRGPIVYLRQPLPEVFNKDESGNARQLLQLHTTH